MKKEFIKRCTGFVLAITTLLSISTPVFAVGAENNITFKQVDDAKVTASLLSKPEETSDSPEPSYAATDEVRVSIVLEGASVLNRGFSTQELADNAAAMSYRQKMIDVQETVAMDIEESIGDELDVQWNLTLAANIISATVEYGQIEEIEKVDGVAKVFIETQYDVPEPVAQSDDVASPTMYSATDMLGMNEVWSSGYTGAGMRIAIIDTGLDTDHQSFSAEAYEYALQQMAEKAKIPYEEYVAGLDLLDKDEIANNLGNLNIQTKYTDVTENAVYKSAKVPFAFNYIDATPYYVTHDLDSQTDHGSHVAGIAAANRYIKVGDDFKDAEEYCKVVGNAPDAQLVVMKVFGRMGGAYTSDFMAAIEDAIVLGCDSVNLSLGSTIAGFADAGNEYQEIMNNLQDPKKNPGSVITIAGGNEYNPISNAANKAFLGTGHLYAEDAVMPSNIGSPGSYTNSLTVASVDNKRNLLNGYFAILDEDGANAYLPSYAETIYNKMKPLTSLDISAKGTGTEYDYVFIDGLGKPEDLENLDLRGKIFICSRGENAFYEKATNAAKAGAAAVMIYNNADGVINMDMSSYGYEAPAVSLTQEAGAKIRELSTVVTDEANKTCFVGKMKIVRGQITVSDGKTYYTMSDFSSWGTTGDMALKPEIAAPGGNIYSVRGDVAEINKYKTNSGTSMATPQVAGVTAAASQFLQETGFGKERGFSQRQLLQSLLMSTATPLKDGKGQYYPLIQQGAGMVNGSAIVGADSFIMMGKNATPSYQDGKVKAELGDDPQKKGAYEFDFTIYNEATTERTFTLSADAFTQDAYQDKSAADSKVQVWYSKSSTIELESNDVFIVDEKAHVGTAQIRIPAGGSQQVTVRINLTGTAKAWLDERYPNGAYMEAFVYAQSSDAEGNAASTHSIPVLAFYGSWTGPSMFDTASYSNGEIISKYNTANTTDRSRVSYAWQWKTEYEPYYGKNYVTVTSPSGDSYALGGNPLVRDDSYLEERNAIGNGVSVERWHFALFRDAAMLSSTARNLTTGEKLYDDITLERDISSSFYDKRNIAWQYFHSESYVGKPLPKAQEGDVIELSITLLPEYYMEGNLGYGKPAGEGATLSISAVIDETLPVVSGITYNSDRGTLEVTAQDNNYISGVVLYNEDGSEIVSYTGADQDAKQGESSVFSVKPNAAGEAYLLQVFDYAMNVCTYYIELEGKEIVFSGSLLAFDLEDNRWVQADKLTDTLKPITKETKTYTAATAVGDVIYAIAYGTELHRLNVADAQDSAIIGDTGIELVDLAYSEADGNLYGITADSKLAKIDLQTAKGTVIGSVPVNSNTLACDANGVFYSNLYGSGKVYAYTLDALGTGDAQYDFNGDNALSEADVQALLDYVAGSGEIMTAEAADLDGDGDIDTRDAYLLLDKIPNHAALICTVPVSSKYMQAMEIDPNSDKLYWSSYCTERIGDVEIGFSVLYEIDPETGTFERYHDVWDQLSCLLVLDKDVGSSFAPISGVTDLTDGDKDKLYKYQNAAEQMGIASLSGVDNARKAELLAEKAEANTTTVTLSSDQVSTNGLYTVDFDPAKLTFVSLQGSSEWNSYQVNSGKITFAYINEMAIAAGEPLAELVFDVADCSAALTVTKQQENNAHMAEIDTVQLAEGHAWGDWEEKRAASCLQEGLKTRTCGNCGASEEQRIPKLTDHNWADWYCKSEPTVNQPVSEYRYCNAGCGAMEYRWAFAESMTASAIDSSFNLFKIGRNRLKSARFLGAEVNSVSALAAEDGRMSYLVELSEQTASNAVLTGRLEVTATTGSGYGSAIKKNQVNAVQWDGDELDYTIELKNGIGTMTAYSYYDSTNFVPLEIYFYIGDGGDAYREPYYMTTPGTVGKMGVWGAAVTKTYWLETTDESGAAHKTGYVWLDADTPQDASVEIEFVTDNDVFEGWKNKGININRAGLTAQLDNGAAELTFCSKGTLYTLYLKNYVNQAPQPYISSGSATVGCNQEYRLDLSTVFYDLNGDKMTYQVSIDGGTAVAVDENCGIRPTKVGNMTLVFVASDGALSSESYTLTLIVTDSTAVIGDVDNNGAINLKDATRLMKYLANWDVEVNLAAADTNGDGEVNLKDATHLMKYLANWPVTLGRS